MVNKADYAAMMDKAVMELKELVARQEELSVESELIDARIAEVKQGIMALGPLCGIHVQSKYSDLLPEYNLLPVGLREGVLAVLGMVKNDSFLTPVAVRDNLSSTGYEIKSKNILPSIHNVLKRLVESGEVEGGDVNGKTGYRLVSKERTARLADLKNPFRRLVAQTQEEIIEEASERRRAEARAAMASVRKVPEEPQFSVATSERKKNKD